MLIILYNDYPVWTTISSMIKERKTFEYALHADKRSKEIIEIEWFSFDDLP